MRAFIMKVTGLLGIPPREMETVPTMFKQIDVPRLKKRIKSSNNQQFKHK